MMSGRHDWKEQSACKGLDPNLFFDKYEEDVEPFEVRHQVDSLCQSCPVRKTCFAVGVMHDPNGYDNWGVWGGFYLRNGKVDVEMNSHKDMGAAYATLVNE